MKLAKYFFLSAFFLFLPTWGKGQSGGNDTVLKGSVIEVIQSYKPQVRQGPKPEWIPQLPPPDTFHRVFNYVVPQQSLFYTYHSDPLKPLALGKDTIPMPFPNYVKAGVGNLSTLFLDAGVGSLVMPGYETFIHVHHISQKGDIKYQQSALSGIEAEGMYHRNNNEWHATLDGERDQYYYYGYDHSTYDYTNGDSLKQTYTTIKIDADYKRKDIGDSKFDYHPSVTGYFYNARFDTHEAYFGFNVPLTYEIDTVFQAEISIYENFAQLKTDSPGINNNLFKITPGISMLKGDVTAHMYVGFAAGKNGDFSFLPDIKGSFIVPNTNYRLSGGWLANIMQNTYRQLTAQNPYIFNNYQLQQTRTDEIFANIISYYGPLQFSGRVSWCNYKSLPTYLDTIGDHKQFDIVYDTVSAISFLLGARYLMSDIYEIGLSGNYYRYYQGTSQYPWNLPDLKLKGDFAIRPLPQLNITAYLSLLSGIHAIDNNNKIVSLKTITDIGVNGEYQLNLRAGVFLQVSNILNENYQQWIGYKSYGINIYGGIRLKF